MPRLVADIHSGALAPRSALGYARIPGQIEWELLPVATAQLTPIATCGMHALTYKTERGRQNWALCSSVSFVRKRGSPIPRCKSKRALGQMARSNFRVRRLGVRFLHAALIPPAIESLAIDITSERFTISEHPPQSQIHKKLEPHIPRRRAVKRQPPSI